MPRTVAKRMGKYHKRSDNKSLLPQHSGWTEAANKPIPKLYSNSNRTWQAENVPTQVQNNTEPSVHL